MGREHRLGHVRCKLFMGDLLGHFRSVSNRGSNPSALRKCHMNVAPIFVGGILLLPGDLVSEIFPRMSDSVGMILAVWINFGTWHAMRKVLRLDEPVVSTALSPSPCSRSGNSK